MLYLPPEVFAFPIHLFYLRFFFYPFRLTSSAVLCWPQMQFASPFDGMLYAALGINAELVIDHAWGWEPTEIKTIKSYKPETNSISSGQVLMEPYEFDKAKLIVKEMTELLALDLVRKGVVTKKIELTIGYDRESIKCVYK